MLAHDRSTYLWRLAPTILMALCVIAVSSAQRNGAGMQVEKQADEPCRTTEGFWGVCTLSRNCGSFVLNPKVSAGDVCASSGRRLLICCSSAGRPQPPRRPYGGTLAADVVSEQVLVKRSTTTTRGPGNDPWWLSEGTFEDESLPPQPSRDPTRPWWAELGVKPFGSDQDDNQYRPSRPSDSELYKPSRPNNQGRPNRPHDGDHIVRPSRPYGSNQGSRPNRPYDGDQAVRPNRPYESYEAVQPNRPYDRDQVVRPNRPYDSDQVVRPNRPYDSDQVVRPNRPYDSDQVVRPNRPYNSDQVVRPNRPYDSDQVVRPNRPYDSDQVVRPSRPDDGEQIAFPGPTGRPQTTSEQTLYINPPFRPSTEPPPREEELRISEIKCNEYSQQVRSNVSALPLVPNPEPISVQVEKCNYNSVRLIVGGEKTAPGEFPHMAALGYRDGRNLAWNCGGTLISEYYVLTAAHCTYTGSGPPAVVRLGEYNLRSNNDGAQPVDYSVSKVIRHPDYKPPAKYNDIGLLRLSRRVVFNKFIRPACLYTKDYFTVDKTTAIGWGRIDYAESASDILLKVSLNIIDNNKCNQLYRSDIKTNTLSKGILPSMLCAGELKGGKDTCQGDSGGPIQISSRNNQCIHYIIGITSFGKFCAGKNAPGVYTRVSYYIPWIESIVWPSN